MSFFVSSKDVIFTLPYTVDCGPWKYTRLLSLPRLFADLTFVRGIEGLPSHGSS